MKFTLKMVVNFIAFVAVILVGIALILKNTSIGGQLQFIANVIAYVMLAVFAFFYAKSKRNIVFVLLWLAAVVLIVVSYII